MWNNRERRSREGRGGEEEGGVWGRGPASKEEVGAGWYDCGRKLRV